MKKTQRYLVKGLIAVLLFGVVTFSLPVKVQATPDTTLAVIAQTATTVGHWIAENATKLYENVLKRAGNIAFKNALRTFTSQIAYDTATRLVEGDWGKSPLFSTQNFGNFLQSVGETTVVDTLDVLGKTNGFMSFDVCNPQSADLKFAFSSALLSQFEKDFTGNERTPRAKARCSWQSIATNWDAWAKTTGRNLSTENFLKTLQNSFSPDNSQVGTFLTLQGNIADKLEANKEIAALNRITTEGYKDITSPISGFIKTPATITKEASKQLTSAGPIMEAEKVSTGDIIADAFGIFTNTLAAKLMKKLFDKGLADVTASRDIFAFNWVVGQTYNAAESLAELVNINFTSGQERVLEPMSQCPDPNSPGPLNCVIPPSTVTAIEQTMTVKEAVAKGYLNGAGFFGFKKSGESAIMDYLNGLPYRSLVILRENRIIPASWEIAASYANDYDKNKSDQVTLNFLMGCFEDTNDSENNKLPASCIPKNDDGSNKIDFNPYYHLVDPNWILKSPESFCAKKGAGYEIVGSSYACTENNVAGTTLKAAAAGVNQAPELSGEILYPACDASQFDNPDREVLKVQRNDQYCADRKSCLREVDGRCVAYGYCLKEEPISNLPGKTCVAQFDTCETFKRDSDSSSFSYLRNTLQECSPADGGCWWYSTAKLAPRFDAAKNSWVSDWSDQNRVYFNNQVETCSSKDEGCTKLSRVLPGTNLVFNGDFARTAAYYANEQIPVDSVTDQNGKVKPVGWDVAKYCADVNDSSLELSSDCSITTSGDIPVDSRFTYLLSAKVNSGSGTINLTGSKEYNIENLSAGVEITIPENTTAVKINIKTSAGKELSIRNVQLLVNKSPILSHNRVTVDPAAYQPDYSQNNNYGRDYFKLAPSYLGCAGYNQVVNFNEKDCQTNGRFWRTDINRCVWSGSDKCADFATVCKKSEVGCQGFKPANNDLPELTGVPATGDYCPGTCVGYESYLETPTKFDYLISSSAAGKLFNFIPTSAKTCNASVAGCEEFTNLDAATAGGENLEYFTDFRQCVASDNASLSVYYTWEGSDTVGYQLKKWEFLKSNLGTGPCVNLTVGQATCQDSLGNTADKYCTDDKKNPECRDFFNDAGIHFYVYQKNTITASAECRAYRRTNGGEIYNVNLALSKRCQAAENGCREYKGNQSNNQKIIFNDAFENGAKGDWYKEGTDTTGLENSTEALNQGGHSLKINTAKIYKNIALTTGKTKEYQLSFWAKKGEVITPIVNNNTLESKLNFNFDTNRLNNEWQYFTTDKITFNPSEQNSVVILSFANFGNVVYLDNIVLKESADIFYVIKNSWNTPTECDAPFVGAQLGCQQYTDHDNNPYFLKSLNSLCSASAIGCEAYLNTQNSINQAGKTQQVNECDAATGGVIKNGGCYINNRLMCKTASTKCSYAKEWSVANDELIYLVRDLSKSCAAEKQGCTMVGKPTFDRQLENYTESNSGLATIDFVKSYKDVYLVNNPDAYDKVACSEQGLFCSGFKGDISGQKYYFDPQGTAQGSTDLSRTCYFKDGKWYETGSVPEKVCYNQSDKLFSAGEAGYTGRVGLCSKEASTCTEIRNPKIPVQEIVARCDAALDPDLAGVCGDKPTDSVTLDGYCVKSINGVSHRVCKMNGNTPCNYTAHDWTCFNDTNTNQARACIVNNIKVCDLKANETTCSYSLLCKSDYYLKNSLTEGQGNCKSGAINDEAGCSLFYDSFKKSGSYSTDSTKKGAQPAGCNSEIGKWGDSDYCNANSYYGVVRDRQCSEWLDCGSAMLATAGSKQQEACSGLVKCLKTNDQGVCIKIEITTQTETVINLSAGQNNVEKLRYLSGYSLPTVNWISNGNTQFVQGRLSPENMKEVGEGLKVLNNGFELNNGSLDDPQAWAPVNLAQYQDRSCQASLDERVAHDGRYSLRISSDVYDNVAGCQVESTGGNTSYYQATVGKTYVLSFYAKSSTGGQKLKAYFKCSNGVITDGPNILFTPTADKWQKFTFSHVLPAGCGSVKIFFRALSTSGTWGVYQAGSVWIDDVTVDPVLAPLGTNNALISKDCRLYPNSESASCSYETDRIYRGWNGYCLDTDPFYQTNPKNPNDYQHCLQWYPVDVLSGQSSDLFSAENDAEAVYTGPRPLYYCLNNTANGDLTRTAADLGKIYGNAGELDYKDKNPEYQPFIGNDGAGYRILKTNSDEKVYLDDLSGIRAVPISSPSGELGKWPTIEFYVPTFKESPSALNCNGDCYYRETREADVDFDPFLKRLDITPASIPNITQIWRFFYKDGENQYSDPMNINGKDRNFTGMVLLINKDNSIYKGLIWFEDGTGDDDEAVGYDIQLIYKDRCETLAEVVSNEGDTKPYLARYNNNTWPTTLKYSYGKNLSGNPMFQSGQLRPYGGFKQPADPSQEVENWPSSQLPISVFQGGSFSGYAGLPLGGTVKKAVCVTGDAAKFGQACLTSSFCSLPATSPDSGFVFSREGVCAGTGDYYCYDSRNITNGKLCSSADDKTTCPSKYTCKQLEIPETASGAYDDLQKLFVKINDVWQWSKSLGQYVKCSVLGNNCTLNDKQSNHSDLSKEGVGIIPMIENLKLSTGAVFVSGGKVSLDFDAIIDPNQLPLRNVVITWGDGEVSDYNGALSGGAKKFYHFYGCITNGAGDKCTGCLNNKAINPDGLSCTYNIGVTIKDNWDKSANNPDLSVTVGK